MGSISICRRDYIYIASVQESDAQKLCVSLGKDPRKHEKQIIKKKFCAPFSMAYILINIKMEQLQAF